MTKELRHMPSLTQITITAEWEKTLQNETLGVDFEGFCLL